MKMKLQITVQSLSSCKTRLRSYSYVLTLTILKRVKKIVVDAFGCRSLHRISDSLTKGNETMLPSNLQGVGWDTLSAPSTGLRQAPPLCLTGVLCDTHDISVSRGNYM